VATAISSPVDVSGRRRWVTLAGVLLGLLLGSVDQTIVGTAMPRVIAELGGFEAYAWVATAFMLASTVSVPIWGKLSDIYGRRALYLIGMSIFTLGSGLAGASQDIGQLIAFRTLQGLGAGAILPVVQTIVSELFPPSERGKWQGLTVAVIGMATIMGPSVGGVITEHWSWRLTFLVNLPLGVLGMVTAGLAMPSLAGRPSHRIDYLGAIALVGTAVPLLLAMSLVGPDVGWLTPQILGLLTLSAVMLVLFVAIERRAPEPIINPSFFRKRVFSVSMVAVFIASAQTLGAITYLPLLVQGVLGESPANSGAILTPMLLGFIVSSICGGQIMSRTGRYRLLALAGFATAAVGMLLLALMGSSVSTVQVVGNLIIAGVGIGCLISLFTIVVQNAFAFEQLGQVTANVQFFRLIGGTVGVALFGSLISTRSQAALRSTLPTPSAVRLSLGVAFHDAFLTSMVAMLVALCITLFLPELPLRRTHRVRL